MTRAAEPASPAAAWVVDASVGVKFVLREPGSDAARALFAALGEGRVEALHVPDLFYAECANVLWKHGRRSGLPSPALDRAMATIDGLCLRSEPAAGLARDALRTALALGISAYDACYVVLAARREVPLVTADGRLVRALAGTRHRACRLDAWRAA